MRLCHISTTTLSISDWVRLNSIATTVQDRTRTAMSCGISHGGQNRKTPIYIQVRSTDFPHSSTTCMQLPVHQNIWRKIQTLGLAPVYPKRDAAHKFIRRLKTLAFLPAEHIPVSTSPIRSTLWWQESPNLPPTGDWSFSSEHSNATRCHHCQSLSMSSSGVPVSTLLSWLAVTMGHPWCLLGTGRAI